MNTTGTKIESLLQETDWLRRIARDLVADPNVADDLAQDAAVAALEHGGGVRGKPRAWLRTVTRHRAARYARQDVRRRGREQVAAQEEAVSATDPSSFELHRRVVEAVHALAEPYRETVVLRFWEDLPPREIAKRMRCPVETAKSRLTRGLAQLRQKLDSDFGSRAAWVSPLSLWMQGASVAGVPKVLALAFFLIATFGLSWAFGLWDGEPAERNSGPEVAVADEKSETETESSETASVAPAAGPRRAPVAAADKRLVRVVDTKGNPVPGARVFRMEQRRKPDAFGAEFKRRSTQPRRGEPTMYDWLATQKHVTTDANGEAHIDKLGVPLGGILAFTDALDGGVQFRAKQKGAVVVPMYPRRVVRVHVAGVGARPDDQVLVAYRVRGRPHMLAWTERGIAQIPMVAFDAMVAIQPSMGQGDVCVLAPTAQPVLQKIDKPSDLAAMIRLALPPTGRLRIECVDANGKPATVTGTVELYVLDTKDHPSPSAIPAATAKLRGGHAAIARVGLGAKLNLCAMIDGRETPIQMPVTAPAKKHQEVVAKVEIKADVEALKRAAKAQRRKELTAVVDKEESAAERRAVRDAIALHDDFAVEVLSCAMIDKGAPERAMACLRAAREAYVKWCRELRVDPSTGRLTQAYINLAYHAPKLLAKEYHAQLGVEDLWTHREDVVGAAGFYTTDKVRDAMGMALTLEAFRLDPHPRVRQRCLFAIGSYARLDVAADCLRSAATDAAVMKLMRGYFPGVVNYAQRVNATQLQSLVTELCAIDTVGESTRAWLRKQKAGK